MADLPSQQTTPPRRVQTAPVQGNPSDTSATDSSRLDGDGEAQPRVATPNRTIRDHNTPGVEWFIRWTKDSFKAGRVLIIDYIGVHGPQGRRKIVAQELQDIQELRSFYSHSRSREKPAFRLIHVQNASWATTFFLRKFNIGLNLDPSDDIVGTEFARLAKYDGPRRRRGKPVLSGKTFRVEHDRWRGIDRADLSDKIAELNGYDELGDPTAMFDIVTTRLSVYIQVGGENYSVPTDSSIRNPYKEAADRGELLPKIEDLDNGSAMIIFDNGNRNANNSLAGSVISARGELESRWRRLSFYLPIDLTDTDSKLASECLTFILKDIFKVLEFQWERTLHWCSEHVSILEEQVYESPAAPDESRAAMLWANASVWLTLEKLLKTHSHVLSDVKAYLAELHRRDTELHEENAQWRTWDTFERVEAMIQEEVIKPTTAVSDLMFRSVAYRDSRVSLKLNASLWRLSWITFIFLPLTFLVGFFGMNVDTLEHNPSIKWYFVAAVCLMVVVLMFWYFVKFSPTSEQQMRQRQLYEVFHRNLSERYPQNWTRHGPRHDRAPSTWVDGLKWRLLTSWYAPHKLVPKDWSWLELGEVGIWSRVKLTLTERWLAKMPRNQLEPLLDDVELGLRQAPTHADGIAVLLAGATQAMAAIAVPSIKAPMPAPRAID